MFPISRCILAGKRQRQERRHDPQGFVHCAADKQQNSIMRIVSVIGAREGCLMSYICRKSSIIYYNILVNVVQAIGINKVQVD